MVFILPSPVMNNLLFELTYLLEILLIKFNLLFLNSKRITPLLTHTVIKN